MPRNFIPITDEGIFKDSTDILQYLDAIAPPNAKLYPTDSQLRRQTEELEDLFDSQLGASTRRWAYFYALNNRRLMQSLWCRGVPRVEQTLFPVIFPWMRSTARRGMNISAESAVNAYEQISSIFEKVGELLSDGRSYLVGDCFCAADITFAALAAPAVTPSTQALPAKMISEINALRKMPAAAYALRLYRERGNNKSPERK